jgi:glutathione S-transferase
VSLTLYSHRFASYCQKVLIALWENEVPFTYRHLEEPGAAEERAAFWPLGRFPVLVDDSCTTLARSSCCPAIVMPLWRSGSWTASSTIMS